MKHLIPASYLANELGLSQGTVADQISSDDSIESYLTKDIEQSIKESDYNLSQVIQETSYLDLSHLPVTTNEDSASSLSGLLNEGLSSSASSPSVRVQEESNNLILTNLISSAGTILANLLAGFFTTSAFSAQSESSDDLNTGARLSPNGLDNRGFFDQHNSKTDFLAPNLMKSLGSTVYQELLKIATFLDTQVVAQAVPSENASPQSFVQVFFNQQQSLISRVFGTDQPQLEALSTSSRADIPLGSPVTLNNDQLLIAEAIKKEVQELARTVETTITEFLSIGEALVRDLELLQSDLTSVLDPIAQALGFEDVEKSGLLEVPFLFETPELPDGWFEKGMLVFEESSNTTTADFGFVGVLASLSRYGDPSDLNPDQNGYVGQIEIDVAGTPIGFNPIHGLYLGSYLEDDNGDAYHQVQTGGITSSSLYLFSQEIYNTTIVDTLFDAGEAYRDQRANEYWSEKSEYDFESANFVGQALIVADVATLEIASPMLSSLIEESSAVDPVLNSPGVSELNGAFEYAMADLLNAIREVGKIESQTEEIMLGYYSKQVDGNAGRKETEGALFGTDGAVNQSIQDSSNLVLQSIAESISTGDIDFNFNRLNFNKEDRGQRDDFIENFVDSFNPITSILRPGDSPLRPDEITA